MLTLPEPILTRATEVVEALAGAVPPGASPWSRTAFLLVGSATTEFADEHSGLDFLILCPDADWPGLARELGGPDELPPGALKSARAAGHRFKYAALPLSRCQDLIARSEDEVLFALAGARVLRDPAGLVQPLASLAGSVPAEVWGAKAREAYRTLRQRKASAAWALRRGQPFVFLDSLVQFLSAAFRLCYYLEDRPPAGRKWLFRGALRTPCGQELRPIIFELLSSLGGVAVLGGSFNLRQNALYALASRVQAVLETALAQRGWMSESGGVNVEVVHVRNSH